MIEFLAGNWDFGLFLAGGACLLLCVVAMDLWHRRASPMPWLWLTAATFLFGLFEWLMTVVPLFPPTSPLLAWRLPLIFVAVISLLEFARRGLGLSGKWRWGYLVVPLLLLNSVLRSLVLTGSGILAGVALWRYFAALPKRPGCWWMSGLATAASFVGVGVLSSSSIDTEEAMATQTLLRGLVALFTLMTAWSLWQEARRLRAQADEGRTAAVTGTERVILLLLGILCVTCWLVVQQVGRRADERERRHLMEQVLFVSSAVNRDRVAALNGNEEDLENVHYRRLKEQLLRMRSAVPQYRFLYLMAKPSDTIIILVDSEPDLSSDYSPPGQEYPEASPGLRKVFADRQTCAEGPSRDRWGSWVSAFTPLPLSLPRLGTVIVGLDVDATDWTRMIQERRLPPLLVAMLLWALLLGFAAAWERNEVAKAALRGAERALRGIFDHVNVAVIVHDTIGRLVDVNEQMCRLFDMSRNRALGAVTMQDLSAPGNPLERLPGIWLKVLAGEPQTFTWQARRPGDGSEFPVEVSLRRMEPSGRPLIVATLRDLTQQRLTEEALVKSERLAAVGQLASGVAHEFNNILTVIRSYVQLLLMDKVEIPQHDGLHNPLQVIERQTHRGATIVTGMMSLARPARPRRQLCRLADIVRDVLQVQRQQLIEENVQVVWRPTDDLVAVDAGQIQQVLLNMVLNARHAMRSTGGGRLTLSVTAGPTTVGLSISDTGCGMDEATVNRIFTPFFTTKGGMAKDSLGIQGVGLGLSVCYQIVKAHGGEIQVRSVPGRGTTFIVELPRDGEVEESAPVLAVPVAGRRGEGRLLIVDDEEDIHAGIGVFLRRRGYIVVSALSADQALAEAKKAPFAFVLCDVNLPGMPGPQLARRIRQMNPETRILFMSGMLDAVAAREAVADLEDAPLLTKPFDLEELMNVIARMEDD